MSASAWLQGIGLGLDLFFEEKRAGDEADILRLNAEQLEAQARETLAAGLVAQAELLDLGERRTGQISALTAASGVTLSGSPLAVLLDQAVESDKDARLAVHTSKVEARALRQQAEIARREAEASEEGTAASQIGDLLEPLKKNAASVIAPFSGSIGF